ncbi:thioredoxin family protein (plasmid) [Iamia sp. SCSIO 61187]|uniref:thioredoxin family protein n=1 Tax=Iamia sp. SCSIO 61187 TaxID=2722752 RepID=UPI001C6291D5|nr:thioredoxin family protein [Iamia sp. SCSIO 61187]QYG94322.1 thioredoxin family protein [Iamia sp. SCSIO 61187]QYG95788.1 thioredoxin family protein [Iamia sp. SCSIO 61187]
MDVTLLYFADCPNWKVADGHLAEVARELPDVTITRQLVSTPEDAARVGFHGSPSILVDGVDVFAQPEDDPGGRVGLSCRVYQTPDGPAGSPTLSQLRAVMTRG